MINTPIQVEKVMNSLREAGFQAFATGECVRLSISDQEPFAWDIGTNAKPEDIFRVFPNATVLNKTFGIVRIEEIYEVFDDKNRSLGEEGIIIDIYSFRKKVGDKYELCEDINGDLSRFNFTVDAMADGLQFIDIRGGSGDYDKNVVKTCSHANYLFEENPIEMLHAVRIAAEMGFSLAPEVKSAIENNNYRLLSVEVSKIRDEFTKLMGARHVSVGIRYLMELDLLKAVLGPQAYERITKNELKTIDQLCTKINLLEQNATLRQAMLYICLNVKSAMPAIEYLEYDEEEYLYLRDTIKDIQKMYYLERPDLLKKFMYEHGYDRYNFLVEVQKAQHVVFNVDNTKKLERRMKYVNSLQKHGEVIFVEDLPINANDLISEGICEDKETAEVILKRVTEHLHVSPKKREREDCLALARKYRTNNISTKLRKMKWF